MRRSHDAELTIRIPRVKKQAELLWIGIQRAAEKAGYEQVDAQPPLKGVSNEWVIGFRRLRK